MEFLSRTFIATLYELATRFRQGTVVPYTGATSRHGHLSPPTLRPSLPLGTPKPQVWGGRAAPLLLIRQAMD